MLIASRSPLGVGGLSKRAELPPLIIRGRPFVFGPPCEKYLPVWLVGDVDSCVPVWLAVGGNGGFFSDPALKLLSFSPLPRALPLEFTPCPKYQKGSWKSWPVELIVFFCVCFSSNLVEALAPLKSQWNTVQCSTRGLFGGGGGGSRPQRHFTPKQLPSNTEKHTE